MNSRLHAATDDIRASLSAAYLQAESAGDLPEMSRLGALATEVDTLRAKLALGALDDVAGRIAAIGVDVDPARDLAPDQSTIAPAATSAAPQVTDANVSPIAWGAVTHRRHGQAFNARVRAIAAGLGTDPSNLMAVMAFETGESFSPVQRNAAGSGATGLIQFIPRTARSLGTTTTKLARMTALAQLDYVEAYFRQATRAHLTALSDLYMAVLWPAAAGKPESYVLFRKPTRAYAQNRGLDVNRDGVITKAEATAKVAAKLAKGMKAGRLG